MPKKNQQVLLDPEKDLKLIDCHCHFPLHNPPKGMISSYEEQYQNFMQSNGQYIISSIEVEDFEFCSKFNKNHPNILNTIGLSPQTITFTAESDIEKIFNRYISFLKKNLNSFIGIGEIGLDFHHALTYQKRRQQINYFKRLIDETKELGKPYVIHVRNPTLLDIDKNSPDKYYTEPDIVFRIIKEIFNEEGILPNHVMWHCFSGSEEWSNELAKHGFYLSIPSSAYGFMKWRNSILKIPLENLLTETDAAWQHPWEMGQFNEPTNVKYAIAAIAHEKSLSQLHISEQVVKNAQKFFNLEN